jgi:hypothetical protein
MTYFIIYFGGDFINDSDCTVTKYLIVLDTERNGTRLEKVMPLFKYLLFSVGELRGIAKGL